MKAHSLTSKAAHLLNYLLKPLCTELQGHLHIQDCIDTMNDRCYTFCQVQLKKKKNSCEKGKPTSHATTHAQTCHFEIVAASYVFIKNKHSPSLVLFPVMNIVNNEWIILRIMCHIHSLSRFIHPAALCYVNHKLKKPLSFSKINDANQRFCCVDGHFKNINMKEANLLLIICFSLGTLVSVWIMS